MARSLKSLFSWESFKHIGYIPSIIFKVKNWFRFTSDYIHLKKTSEYYVFRDGIKFQVSSDSDASTIAVIFIKKDYGDVKDNLTIIDIGANIGTYSLFAASTAKDVKVYAYEPMKETFEQLKENIRINKMDDRVHAFNLGVASKKGSRNLFISSSSAFNSMYTGDKQGKSSEITCTTLKEIFEDNNIARCDMLKIDCEGAEYEIFYSLDDKHYDKIKEIRMEYHNIKGKEGYDIRSLIEFLKGKGFEITKQRKDMESSGILWVVNSKLK